MKTIVSLAFASLWAWSAATAQIPPYFSKTETGAIASGETPTLESFAALSAAGENSKASFPDFNAYVRAKLRYPGVAREMGTEGLVEVEATVKANGKLANIRITQGLSFSCDKEVLRLLSGMPAWNPARRNGKPYDQKIHLKVRFRLEPF